VHTGLNYNHLFDSAFFNAEFGFKLLLFLGKATKVFVLRFDGNFDKNENENKLGCFVNSLN